MLCLDHATTTPITIDVEQNAVIISRKFGEVDLAYGANTEGERWVQLTTEEQTIYMRVNTATMMLFERAEELTGAQIALIIAVNTKEVFAL
ncbi:hypothetical protein FLK61_35430 [Paenalkalicoccus suaedae]|uniref:Uncharacterized protein n=1 Tax=Paenalkalicoccus suaedae TaxID=2592382 RepID=A0A859FGM9_9BACI|nr:hypothetical protein [Paenalkalicoccus suaedae]QKS71960.1 hypothetical protein FLK61_35430 [Paenalkalicoccus suaedae]